MSEIFKDLERLKQMQARLDSEFTHSSKSGTRTTEMAQTAAAYAAVTEAVHNLGASEAFTKARLAILEQSGKPEDRAEAAKLRMENGTGQTSRSRPRLER